MRNQPVHRRTAVLCTLLAGAVPLSGSTPAHAGSASPNDRVTSVDFGACPPSVPSPAAPDRVECGTVRVPLDADRPDGEQIGIAVSRIRAGGGEQERRGALLVNPGGPGGSGLSYAVTKRAKLPERVRRSYDVIGFDPRGVGHSAPADCGEMGGLFRAPAADPVPHGRAAEQGLLRSLQDLARDCADGVGDALPHLSTEQTAQDMDAVRAALGERRISYLGVSYGTYLGAAYAAAFPHRTDRMVLDSVVGPWSWHDFDVRQAHALLRQRNTFFTWLARDHTRFGLGGSGQRVRFSYERVRAGLEREPVHGFGAAEFDRAVYGALGRTERWAGVGEGLRDYLRDGDADGLRPDASGNPEDAFDSPASRNFEAANRSVKCADGPGPDASRVLHDVRQLRRLDPLPILTGLEAAACTFWPHRPQQRTPLGGTAEGTPPALLVASEHDPVTPVEGAHEMRRELPGSRLVTLHDDYSHGVFASRKNDCVDGTVTAYLVDGEAPDSDVGCEGPGLP